MAIAKSGKACGNKDTSQSGSVLKQESRPWCKPLFHQQSVNPDDPQIKIEQPS